VLKSEPTFTFVPAGAPALTRPDYPTFVSHPLPNALFGGNGFDYAPRDEIGHSVRRGFTLFLPVGNWQRYFLDNRAQIGYNII
jgi:hypothetical protein